MSLEHMVWIKFKDGVDDRRQQQHLDALRGLADKVPGIRHLAVGRNITARSAGYTHGLVVRLDSADALAVYRDHPDHVPVAEALKQDADLLAMDIEY